MFVPDRAVVRGDVLFGIDIDFNAGTVGTALHDDPMYLGVFGGIYHLCFSAIYSGAARAALDEYEHIIRTRKAFGAAPVTLIEDGDVQRTLGDVLTKIDCAEAILWGAMEHWDAYLDQLEAHRGADHRERHDAALGDGQAEHVHVVQCHRIHVRDQHAARRQSRREAAALPARRADVPHPPVVAALGDRGAGTDASGPPAGEVRGPALSMSGVNRRLRAGETARGARPGE